MIAAHPPPCLGHIMFIDDTEFDRLSFDRLIRRNHSGFSIDPFSSARCALNYMLAMPARLDAIDLILLDVNMPTMSGLQFLECAKEKFGARMPSTVVMLTQPLAKTDLARAEATGLVTGWIEKPLSPRKLSELLGSDHREARYDS